MWGVQATVGISPATRGSAGLFPQETRRPAPLRLLASLYYGDRFHFITVYITCTTVASRVAANTCDTHLRFLTKPLSFSCLASSPFLDSAERPCNKKSFRRHGLVNNCLLVPLQKGFLKSGPRLPKRSRHSRPSNLWEHGEHTEVNSHKQFPLTWGTEIH